MAERKEMNDGFIVISKKLRKWRYYHNSTARGLWIYILLEANWADQYSKDGVLVPRGSFIRSLRTMAEETELSINTVRYWLKKFVENGEITTQQTTHRYTMITVVNYSKYQDYQKGNHTPTDTLTDTPTDTLTDTDITRVTRETKETRGGTKGFVPPTLDEVIAFAREIGYPQYKAEKFFRNYSAKKWKAGNSRLTNWQEKLQEWKSEDEARETSTPSRGRRGRVAQLPDYKQKPQEELVDATSEDVEEFRKLQKQHAEQLDK